MAITSVNPATGELLRTFEPDSGAEIERKLALAATAFSTLRRSSLGERAALMVRAAEILENGKDRFGRLMTLEMGKTLRSARDEAAKCALACRYYAENAERLLADERGRYQRRAQLRAVPAARAGAGDHAVELPVLAGVPVRRARAHGGERRPAQACLECAAMRAGDREYLPRGGFSRGRIPDAADRFARSGARDRRRAREGRHAHRQRAGGQPGGRARRKAHQEDRARTRRQRSVYRNAERRSRRRGDGPRWPHASSTTASPVSQPSGSWWRSRLPRRSNSASSRPWKP